MRSKRSASSTLAISPAFAISATQSSVVFQDHFDVSSKSSSESDLARSNRREG
jgi:hypothetical protein